MKCAGYVFKGLMASYPYDLGEGMERNPDDYNMDIMFGVEDETSIYYAFPIWETGQGMSDELKDMTSDMQSVFPNNPVFIRYCDMELDEIHVFFDKPIEIEESLKVLTDVDIDGCLDQVFIMDNGELCNLSDISAYLKEENQKQF